MRYLARSQLIVALPRAGVPGCDLLVTGEKRGHAIRIQVKTGTQSTRTDKVEGPIYLWHTAFKVIDLNDEHLCYAYVWLNNWLDPEKGDNKHPEVFFVPARVVVETMNHCKAVGDGEFFWMKVEDATQYKGQAGLQPILAALGKIPVAVDVDAAT